jgi:hypothetical protein
MTTFRKMPLSILIQYQTNQANFDTGTSTDKTGATFHHEESIDTKGLRKNKKKLSEQLKSGGESLSDVVLGLVLTTSEKFVPTPTIEDITTDLILGLADFRGKARWMEEQRNRRKEKQKLLQTEWRQSFKMIIEEDEKSKSISRLPKWLRKQIDNPEYILPNPKTIYKDSPISRPRTTDDEDERMQDEEEEELRKLKAKRILGLGTNARPMEKMFSSKPGSAELEVFLRQLESKLLDKVMLKTTEPYSNGTSTAIKQTLQMLKEDTRVCIPTDKTNSFQLMEKNQYLKEVKIHLAERAKPISKTKLAEVHAESKLLLLKHQEEMTKGERGFLEEKLETRAIPAPKLLIKDHKKIKKDGTYPTRLIIPATNFTSGFAKIGKDGIENLFKRAGILFNNRTIEQASTMKEETQVLNLNEERNTITSFDAEAMYPSIKYQLIEDAIWYYAGSTNELNENALREEEMQVIRTCLELLKFSMSNTLIDFDGEYYEYDGDLSLIERGLTIGGFESAYLADLVMAYILEVMEHEDPELFEVVSYMKMYRDDGWTAFNKKMQLQEVVDWLAKFQRNVDELSGNKFLQFTSEIWLPGSKENNPSEKVTINNDKAFPFLDMETRWDEKTKNLLYDVHLKKNQQLKYLNSDSQHADACFKAIPTGVCKRLIKLTTITNENKNKTMEEVFPIHIEKLENAGLINEKLKSSKLGALNYEERQSKGNVKLQKAKAARDKQRRRSVFFKISKSEIWREKSIQTIISEIKSNFPSLKWLRVSMCIKRFSNLREGFQSDLSLKLNEELLSADFMPLKCNCNKASKRKDGSCAYAGQCRTKMVVYEATCIITGKKYIGNTQRTVKKRIQEHVSEVKNKVVKGESSDSFANHFCKFIPKPSPGDKIKVQEHLNYKVKILWKGDPISCMKSFGKKSCKLCMKERLAIIKAIYQNKKQVINSCNEIYGSCRHKTHFHRYIKQPKSTASTDESIKDERVMETPDSTKSIYISGSQFFNENDDLSAKSMTDSESLSSIDLDDRPTLVVKTPHRKTRRRQTIPPWS